MIEVMDEYLSLDAEVSKREDGSYTAEKLLLRSWVTILIGTNRATPLSLLLLDHQSLTSEETSPHISANQPSNISSTTAQPLPEVTETTPHLPDTTSHHVTHRPRSLPLHIHMRMSM